MIYVVLKHRSPLSDFEKKISNAEGSESAQKNGFPLAIFFYMFSNKFVQT